MVRAHGWAATEVSRISRPIADAVGAAEWVAEHHTGQLASGSGAASGRREDAGQPIRCTLRCSELKTPRWGRAGTHPPLHDRTSLTFCPSFEEDHCASFAPPIRLLDDVERTQPSCRERREQRKQVLGGGTDRDLRSTTAMRPAQALLLDLTAAPFDG